MNMNKLFYELWGSDTFEGRSFLIKVFNDKKAAERALAESRKRALSQPATLRDTFWINELTIEQIKERDWYHEKLIKNLENQGFYDERRLRNYVVDLVMRLMEIIELDKQGLLEEKSIDIEENNPYKKDCYNIIGLSYYRKEELDDDPTKHNVVPIISFRNGGLRSSWGDPIQVDASESTYQMLIEDFKTMIQLNEDEE